jgi:broad-specificity NMP kinase
MEKDVISIADAADKLGCDKSSLLKRLKKNGYRIGKVRGDNSRGQIVSVIKTSDFNDLMKNSKTVQW